MQQRSPPHVGGYGLVLRALQRTFAIMPAADDTKALHPLQLGIPTFELLRDLDAILRAS